ncbi:hypothetical protein Tco_1228969, partial [Tanacetum coccineum]
LVPYVVSRVQSVASLAGCTLRFVEVVVVGVVVRDGGGGQLWWLRWVVVVGGGCGSCWLLQLWSVLGDFSLLSSTISERLEGKLDDFLRRWEGKIENTERCPFMDYWLNVNEEDIQNRTPRILASTAVKHHQKKGELNGAVTIQERTNNKDDAIEEDAAIGMHLTIDISTMEKEAKPSAHRMAKKELACNAFDYAIYPCVA